MSNKNETTNKKKYLKQRKAQTHMDSLLNLTEPVPMLLKLFQKI
jgi:hypothetical protein